MLQMQQLRRWLATPVDAAGLAWVRMGFGLIIAWEMWRYVSNGWVWRYWHEPVMLFPYWPFTFLERWPAPWMSYVHVAVVAAAALGVAAGWRYRFCSIVLFFGFTWLFLLDQCRYLNHFYLASLIAFLLMWVPADREASVDVMAGRVQRSAVPAWSLLLMRFMVGVPYFYGGLAKIEFDWLRGAPMRSFLSDSAELPIVGPLLVTEPSVALFTWGGLLFDLLVVPLLLWRRTRVVGMGLMLAFHLLNSRLLRIGIFPWMMILLTLVFMPPDWPRRVWDDVRQGKRPAFALAAGAILGFFIGSTLPSQPSTVNALVAAVGVAVFFWEIASYGWDHGRPSLLAQLRPGPDAPEVRPMSALGFASLAAFVAIQLLVPLRHLVIPGNANWTEEGHRWAWHMKLRYKRVEHFSFRVIPPGGGEPYEVNPRKLLASHQYKKVAASPELVVMLAHWIERRAGGPEAAVYADVIVGLTGRPGQRLIDPRQDLTLVDVPWWPPAPWILPLYDEYRLPPTSDLVGKRRPTH